MRAICCALFALIAMPVFASSPTEICWRGSYPQIPGEWASTGSVIEAGNRFQIVPGVTIELWSTSSDYADAQRRFANHQPLPAAKLVKTVVSGEHGAFNLGAIQTGSYELRAHMEGREPAFAYVTLEGSNRPQWVGRGLKIAVSPQDNGCSRIYPAGLDDTDCGVLDCEALPVGRIRVIYADDSPLSGGTLAFHRHTKRRGSLEFTLTTDSDGFTDVPSVNGCYDISVEGVRPRSAHLCFRPNTAFARVIVTLPAQ